MEVEPLVHHRNDLRGGLPIHNAVNDADVASVAAIREMNVRRVVVFPVEEKDNTEKSTNLWHNIVLL